MSKPKNTQNNKIAHVRTRFVKRGSMTKKKDKLKKLELESSQQTITEVEKKEEVNEEMKRREREEGRRRWLQDQRFKYPVAPDGYIPNSIVRRNLRPHVPHPPEKQPDNTTKSQQLSLLERRMSRLEKMNSVGMLGLSESRLAYSAASAASRQTSASSAISAVDRERPSSKKKGDRADVVNDVITQMRQTSPQLTSFLELEDIAEVEPRLEKSATSVTPENAEGSAREAETDRGRGVELGDEEGRRGIEDEVQENDRTEEAADSGTEDNMELRGRGKDVDPTDPLPLSPSLPHQKEDSSEHHENSHSSVFSSSIAEQPAVNGDQDQASVTQHPNQQENEDVGSADSPKNSLQKDEDVKDAEEDDATIPASSEPTAADDARGDAEKEAAAAVETDVRGRREGEEADDGSRPSKMEIPRIVEPDEEKDRSEDEDKSDAEQLTQSGESEKTQLDGLTDEKGVVAEHDGNGKESTDVTGSPPHEPPPGGGNLKRNEPSSHLDIEEDAAPAAAAGGQPNESQGFDTKEDLVKVLDISMPYGEQLDAKDSAPKEEATRNEATDDEEKAADLDRDLLLNRVTKEEPEVKRDECGNERRKADGGENGAEWGDGDPLSSSPCGLRPPCNHDDDLDLTSFNSLRAATNTSLSTFSDMDESQNRDKGNESSNFINSNMAGYLNEFSYEMEKGRDGKGKEEKKEMDDDADDADDDENGRCWSPCSNGRLNRRYNREAMEDGWLPSPPLGWHLPWLDRYYREELPPNTGSSKADRRGVADSEVGVGFLPQLLSKDEKKKRRHHGCDYSILVQRRMHEHISITRYLRTKRLTEVLCDLGRPINANIIKFQYSA